MNLPSTTLSEVIASGARPKSKAMLLAEAIQALTWPMDLTRHPDGRLSDRPANTNTGAAAK